MSIDIHIMPVNRDFACESRLCDLSTCIYMECMSIDILYVEILAVDRLLYPIEKYTMLLIFTCKLFDGGGGAVADQVFI